jgi:hypothetical protein
MPENLISLSALPDDVELALESVVSNVGIAGDEYLLHEGLP